jgi:hypothetical protein
LLAAKHNLFEAALEQVRCLTRSANIHVPDMQW